MFFKKRKGYVEIGEDAKPKKYTDRQRKILDRQNYLRVIDANK